MILSVVFFVLKKMSKGSKRRPEDKKKIETIGNTTLIPNSVIKEIKKI